MTDKLAWTIGASGAVVHEGHVLMVRHTYGQGRGRWALPGGYTNHDERLDQTAVREVREEAGLEAEVVVVIGLRTRYTVRVGAVFVLFRMRLVSGEPHPDGVEVDQAGWFSAQEVAAMPDEEIFAAARNAVPAALRGATGLPEDRHFPEKDETYRAFLVELEA
jgi:ADP-ribose pyrophosphatase YjhB (NUDIX family)